MEYCQRSDPTGDDRGWPSHRRCDHNPSRIFSCHAHHQGFHFRWNRGAAWILPVFGAMELVGDELPIPSEDRVGFSDAGDLSQHFALPDLGESGALGIAQPQFRRKLRPQNTILCGQKFVLQQQLLVHRARHVRQQSKPLLVLHPSAYLTVATGRFRFLTIRAL